MPETPADEFPENRIPDRVVASSAEAAGVVLGTAVPIVLTSRADDAATRLASCALGVLVARGGR